MQWRKTTTPLGVGWLEIGERAGASTAYRLGLPLHGAMAAIATGWLATGAPTPVGG